MNKNNLLKIIPLSGGVFVLSLALVYTILAWTEPTLTPPNNNVAAPINTSATYQKKFGPLGFQGTSQEYRISMDGNSFALKNNALAETFMIDQSGKVGIGTTAPAYLVDAAGYVNGRTGLCINGDCRAAWPTLSGAILPNGTASGQTLYYNGSAWNTSNFLHNTGSAIGINTTNTTQQYVSGLVNVAYNSAYDSAISITGAGQRFQGLNIFNAVSSSNAAPNIWFSTSRGTLSSRQQSQPGDRIGTISFNSCNGAAGNCWGAGAAITGKVADNSTNGWAGELIFQTSPKNTSTLTQRMKIAENGNVSIGNFTASYLLQLASDSAGKPNGGSWSNSSDRRLKKNIEPMSGALEKIGKLQGVNFEWINPEEHGQSTGAQGGFIAQDVQKVFPNWIQQIDAAGADKPLAAQDGKILSLTLPFEYDALVVEAIKELETKVAQLERSVAAAGTAIKDGVGNFKNILVTNFSVKRATFKKIESDNIRMKDKTTGDIYCIQLNNGELKKMKYPCNID
jgi:hypothetical protein